MWTDEARKALKEVEEKYDIEVVSIEHHQEWMVRCEELEREVKHLRALAGAVSAGDGDYRGVIEWCGRRYAIGPRWSRLAGPDSRTITKAARHDLCGNE